MSRSRAPLHCAECGHDTGAPANRCGHCGAPLDQPEMQDSRIAAVGYGVGVPDRAVVSSNRPGALSGFDSGRWFMRLIKLVGLGIVGLLGVRACQPDFDASRPPSDRKSGVERLLPNMAEPESEQRGLAPGTPSAPSRTPHRFDDPQNIKRRGQDAIQQRDKVLKSRGERMRSGQGY